MTSFYEFLKDRIETSGFSTEDTLASFLPLLRETIDAHAAGCAAPLAGLDALQVAGVRIWFEQARRAPLRDAESELRRVEQTHRADIEIVAEARRASDADLGDERFENLELGQPDQPITRPVYLPGYVSWEQQLGHHDPRTDVFNLGMILASLACGLDFYEPADLARFVTHRRNLFALQGNLHPVIVRAIGRMTELDRHRRAQDLAALLFGLEHYREQQVDFELDLAQIQGFSTKDRHTRQAVILSKLRERLFDISRRNRLLQFTPTMQTVNLTQASVPLSFDIRNIRPDQLLVWNRSLHEAIQSGKPLPLNKYLNFAEALYLPSVLDRILADSRRDLAEFGFAQLRLVICFLHWADVKQQPAERYDSPLVLLPVHLVKKKGIRDTYQLEPLSTDAEVNPVIRHQFQQLYGIQLPETLDLTATDLDAFFAYLTARIEASEPGVTLNKIDRPRIELIHEKARRKLDQYRRRARIAGRGVRTFMDLDYSYDPANFHPLGIKLFSAKIRPPATRLRSIIEERPRPRSFLAAESAPPMAEKERSLYNLREGGEENPYVWNFDLCSVTLANFKYRKMSLVRDYETLLDDEPANPALDATFSLVPRPVDAAPPVAPPLEDRYDVVPCDPTQATAIAQARSGRSYIIQGPPGTGKSQTITNLIADFIAHGKRVLFVCEKRAAIDVVYARLRQRGLADLCSLIHDSQTDKKQFVLDLKQAYESLIAEAEKRLRGKRQRTELLERLSRELAPLRHFDTAMRGTPPSAGLPLRELLGRALELRAALPPIAPLERERLPAYTSWWEHRDAVARFADALAEIQPDGVLARHPLRLLSGRLAELDEPLGLVTRSAEAALAALARGERLLSESGIPADQWQTLERAQALVNYAADVLPLARLRQMALLDAGSERAQELASELKKSRKLEKTLATAREANRGWRQKLPRGDAALALAQARAFETGFVPWIRPAWWRLRGILRRAYDFSTHMVQPSWSQVLTALETEYAAAEAVEAQRAEIGEQFKLAGNVDELLTKIGELQQSLPTLPTWLIRIHAALVKSDKGPSIVDQLAAAGEPVGALAAALQPILDQFVDRPLTQLRQDLSGIQSALDQLPDFLQCVGEIASVPAPLGAALRTLPFAMPQIEAAIVDRTLEDIYRADRVLGRFTTSARNRHAARLDELYTQWQDANAQEVRRRVQQRFVENVQLASQPAGQLSAADKEFKARYNRGRRALEHEFGKSMRFRSIRDLVAEESGEVIKDLKPVWLMSPLSVSDTLPLDGDLFDVVIFDEASQITLEESVPTIVRARQAIVVGDQMQLPPTDFFATRRAEDDEESALEDEADTVQYDLEGNSFLNHAAKNLPSTMLGWHYRSRSESLISFSNWAFYEGRLLTVPEEDLPSPGRAALVAEQPSDGAAGADELLTRSVSFHFICNTVYENRRNRGEADYIAHLVRRILTQRSGASIGVIAFSEAQQSEIEAALERLAQEDAEFRDLLDAEYEREEDGQFVGLLVKNLENIQGDERDVIVLSICYGYGPNGKMLMNFGPINKSGGEKRLNVAFSRAKRQMAVVSSIHSTDIKNEYNDGANCLKNYLRYAEAVSAGQTDAARRVLAGMSRWHEAEAAAQSEIDDPLGQQIAAALVEHGYLVDHGVGQSHFRCDLAVRRTGDTVYRLGILLDNEAYYEQSDVMERDMMRPRLLRTFGWTITHVLAKDWYHDRDGVLARLLAILAGEQEAMEEAEPAESTDAVTEDAASDLAEEQDVVDRKQSRRATTDLDEYVDDSESDAAVDTDRGLAQGDNAIDETPLTNASAESNTRHFEFNDESSSKFWEISAVGVEHTVRFGKIGTPGQTRTKAFSTSAEAAADVQRLIREKLAKGYRETT